MSRQIKFLTLNTLHGGELMHNIKPFLLRENADVMVFQEVYDGINENLPERRRTVSVLKELFPDYHSAFSPVMGITHPDGTYGWGNLLLSRFPILRTELAFFGTEYAEVPGSGVEDFSDHPKGIQMCELQFGEKVLFVGNVHGIWGFDGNDSPERLKMSEIIIRQIKGKNPCILAGDFNIQPETETIANIEKHLTNVFMGELTSTFNMRHKTKPGYATAVVDMVFVSPDIEVLEKTCPDDDVSDHKPLVVELMIKK